MLDFKFVANKLKVGIMPNDLHDISLLRVDKNDQNTKTTFFFDVLNFVVLLTKISNQ